MSKIIDIFTKKEKKLVSLIEPKNRAEECKKNIKLTGICECQTCTDKAIIADRLVTLSNYLCLDYMERTGNTLLYKDWLEIMITATLEVKKLTYPKK